ncbi:MAG: ArsR family transcriptional regulator [Sphingobium sp.]
MTVHMLPDRALPNQEAVDLVVALQRCLANFHGRRHESPILLPAADGWSARLDRYRRARRLRHLIIADERPADAAWDMLLFLYQAELDGRGVTVDDVAQDVGVPPDVALSHILGFDRRGLLLPPDEPQRATDAPVRLSPLAVDAMTSWLRLALDGGEQDGDSRHD